MPCRGAPVGALPAYPHRPSKHIETDAVVVVDDPVAHVQQTDVIVPVRTAPPLLSVTRRGNIDSGPPTCADRRSAPRTGRNNSSSMPAIRSNPGMQSGSISTSRSTSLSVSKSDRSTEPMIASQRMPCARRNAASWSLGMPTCTLRGNAPNTPARPFRWWNRIVDTHIKLHIYGILACAS